MSVFHATLGPRVLGAEVLLHIAHGRLSGTLSFGAEPKLRRLTFKDGRPESGADADGNTIEGRPAVSSLARVFAALSSGQCTFTPGTPQVAAGLGIDTLGESLVAMLQGLQPTQLDGVFAARGKYKVEPTPRFNKLAEAVEKVGGPRVAAPAAGATLAALGNGADGATQRAWVALLVLGGIKSEAPTPIFDPAAPAQTPSVPVASKAAISADPALVKAKAEIDEAFARVAGLDHYALLGVSRDAPADVIRKAYFEQAKLWHSDRFAGLTLDDESRGRAEELFRRADEANRILTNATERSNYDWTMDRQAQGLPTDAAVVLEAESLFHKAQVLVRRGQAAAAEPLLRRAVEMNRGEAEFWAYLGFAVFSAKGAAAVAEAEEHLQKSLQMNDKLDVAHEFLGRVAHIQGDLAKARQHFADCLELNPKNRDAEREVRLLSMREEAKDKKSDKSPGGLLGRLLKR